MHRSVEILIFTLPLLVSAAQFHYTPSGDCENEQVCEYLYSMEQERFHGNPEDPITVFTTVQIACESNGMYGSLAATRYCMTVNDIDGNFFTFEQDEGNFTSATKQYLIQQYLSGWFCFVQTSEGAVVSVIHSQNEDLDIVNFKKSISASFQANLKGTTEEEEVDPQSRHMSHYSYEEEDGKTKMHRTVMTEDVMEYPMHASTQDIQLFKEEDVEYEEGHLTKSNGTTRVSFNHNSHSEDYDDTESDTVDIFTLDGRYSLELKLCRQIPYASRQKKSVTRRYIESNLSMEESLMAKFNQTKLDKEELNNIQNVLRDEYSILKIIENFNNSKDLNMLEKALILEHKYGTLKGYTSTLDIVLNYLEQLSELNTEDALLQRAVIYSLLSAESSLRSQHALIESYNSATDSNERNSLVIAISTISYPDDQLISQLEAKINETDISSPLLLAYGALVSNVAPKMQRKMVFFLINRLPEAERDNDTLIQLIHSLGNTQSQIVIEYIVDFVHHNNEEIQLAAVSALRFFTGESFIQQKFMDILIQNTSEALVSAIINALYSGFQHDEGSMQVEEDMIEVLMNVTLQLDNENLYMELLNYFIVLDTEETLKLAHILQNKIDHMESSVSNSRQQRDVSTTYWPSSHRDFNVIAPQSARASDVSSYPTYRAYLWSKKIGKTSGTYKFYLQTAAGYFAGRNQLTSDVKLFLKVLLRLRAHQWEYNALKIEGLCERRNDFFYNVKYTLRIGSRVVSSSISTSSLSYPLPTARTTLFSINFPLVIYSVTVNFAISGHIRIGGSINMQVSGFPRYASAEVVLRASASIEGSASVSLLAVVVGASLEATLPYNIGLKGSAKLCPLYGYRICLRAFDEWPGSYITLAAFYQIRYTRWCSGWINYPCGYYWGPRRTWSALSFTWRIYSSGGRNYYTNYCSGYCLAL